MACVLKGSHSFTCTLTRSSAIGMCHTWLCLPSRSWYSFTDPGGMEGWVDGPWCEVSPAEIRICNLPIAKPALYQTATSTPLMNKIQKSAGCPSYCHIWLLWVLTGIGLGRGGGGIAVIIESWLLRWVSWAFGKSTTVSAFLTAIFQVDLD